MFKLNFKNIGETQKSVVSKLLKILNYISTFHFSCVSVIVDTEKEIKGLNT